MPSNICDFCKEEKDSIEHLFWNCTYVGRFWQALENLIIENCTTAANMKLTRNLVLFGTDNNIKTDNVFDLIILLAKLYIYKCKFDKTAPSIPSFKNQLKQKYKVYSNIMQNSVQSYSNLTWTGFFIKTYLWKKVDFIVLIDVLNLQTNHVCV